MKHIAVTLAALALFATPSLADTIHTDGLGRTITVVVNESAKQDFGATVTPVRSNSGKKTNFGGGHIFKPHDLRGGGR